MHVPSCLLNTQMIVVVIETPMGKNPTNNCLLVLGDCLKELVL